MADRTIRSFKNRSITSYHDILTSPILTRICLRIALEGMWQLSCLSLLIHVYCDNWTVHHTRHRQTVLGIPCAGYDGQ